MSEHQPSLSDDDGRNVHFFDGSTGDMLGGLFQNGSITQANFIHMLSIVLVIVPNPHIEPASFAALGSFTVEMAGQTISQTNKPLTPGDYKIYALPDGGKCYDNRSKEARNPA